MRYLVLVIGIAWPSVLVAQPRDENRVTTVVLYTENDDWPPDTGTDKNYTNGLRVTLERNYDMWGLRKKLPRLFGWIPAYIDCSFVIPEDPADLKCASSAWHVIGQQFYTPDDITIPTLIPTDRPYAGWLYVGGAWKASTFDTLVATDVYVGFTGKPSLAQPVQTTWHDWIGAPRPEGWDHQIGTRLGIIVGHHRHWAFDRVLPGGLQRLEFVPYVGGTAGNIMTDAYAGGQIRIGKYVSRDWTPPGIQPRRPATPDAADKGLLPDVEVYIAIDGQGRALAYNAFIDAAPDHALRRKHVVADAGVGVGFRFRRLSAMYRIALVSPEYSQALVHDYKALRFTFSLN